MLTPHIKLKNLANYFSIQDFMRYARSIATTIKEVDSALIELRKVSDASSLRLQQNFQKSAETAKELGRSQSTIGKEIKNNRKRRYFQTDDSP